jgi:ligand-binding sensor domain-containing protein
MRVAPFVLVIAGTLPAAAGGEAPPGEFERISLERGLSQSIVEAITQDERGFLWFATEDGLNRYDGYRFTVYRSIPGNAASLSYNETKTLCVARDGTVWVGVFQGGLNRLDPARETVTRWVHDPTDPSSLAAATVRALTEAPDGTMYAGTEGGGLDRIDPHSGRITHLPAGPGGLPHGDVRALTTARDGTIWIGTNGGGLAHLDPASGGLETFRNDPTHPGSLAHDAIRALLIDHHDTLWVGTYGGGVDRFDPSTRAFAHHRHDDADPESLGGDRIRALYEDHVGALWVGTDGAGLDRRDPASGAFTHHRNAPLEPRSLSSDRVWSLFEDRSRVLWAGTYGGGLSKLDLARKPFRHFRNLPGNPDSLGQNIVWSLFEHGDALWIGTDSGGLDRFDRASGRWTHFRHDPNDPASLSQDTVRVAFVDRDGTLWAATNGGGLNRLNERTGRFTHFRHDPADPGSLAHDELRSIMQARDGALWIGTYGGGLDRLDPRTGAITHHRNDPRDPTSLSNDFVRTVVEDRDGAMWVGTQGGGLNRLDPHGGTFRRYRNDPADAASLSSDYVLAVLMTRDGTLWLGTFGGGLNRFDRSTGRFTRWGARDGLSSDSIYAMLEDEDGRLWLSTTNGLTRLDPKRGDCGTYDVRDGLQSNEFNGGSAHRTASGELLFGGINGFNAFFPAEIRTNPEPPVVAITEVSLFNRPLRPGVSRNGRVPLARAAPYAETLRLAHDESVFSIEFAALHFSAPQKNRYAYRMEGFRPDWIPADASQRVATFTGLPAGNYVFRVRAANCDGVWNDAGARLAITIDPPFWATWWFRAGSSVLLIGVAATWFRSHLATVRMRTQLAAAHDAQMSILPQEPPAIAGFDMWGTCLPASEVGGDFFDWIWLEGNPRRLAVAVGDVAGKGMTAAMAAVMSDGMFAVQAAHGSASGEVLTALNGAMRPKLGRRSFAALCVAVLEPEVPAFHFANAGLCEPIFKGAAGARFLAAEGPSFPLGAMAATRYASRSVPLAPGDVVLLCTDGVPEAVLPGGAQLGYEALLGMVDGLDTQRMDARAIVDAVVDGVRRAARGAGQSDDMAVVAIRYDGTRSSEPVEASA